MLAALVLHVDAAWATIALGSDLECGAFNCEPGTTTAAAATAASVAAGSSPRDFKLLLSLTEVTAALTAGGVATVMAALESVRQHGAAWGGRKPPLSPRAVVWALRRTEPTGCWINFRGYREPGGAERGRKALTLNLVRPAPQTTTLLGSQPRSRSAPGKALRAERCALRSRRASCSRRPAPQKSQSPTMAMSSMG